MSDDDHDNFGQPLPVPDDPHFWRDDEDESDESEDLRKGREDYIAKLNDL